MGLRKVHLRLGLIHSAKSARPPDSIDGRATCADVGPLPIRSKRVRVPLSGAVGV